MAMKKFVAVVIALVAVMFAPMVGATRVEAGGLGDIFNGNSSLERVLGAGAIGAAAGAAGGAILGKDIGPAKGAMAGAAIGGIIQFALEATDNVPISCGRDEVYRDPRTGQVYCGGQGQYAPAPQYAPVSGYPQPGPITGPVMCIQPGPPCGGRVVVHEHHHYKVVPVGGHGGHRGGRNRGGYQWGVPPQMPNWGGRPVVGGPTPHISTCQAYPHLCRSSLGYMNGRFEGAENRAFTDWYQNRRLEDNLARERRAWEQEAGRFGYWEGFSGGGGHQ